jgi:hypothetical protein
MPRAKRAKKSRLWELLSYDDESYGGPYWIRVTAPDKDKGYLRSLMKRLQKQHPGTKYALARKAGR